MIRGSRWLRPAISMLVVAYCIGCGQDQPGPDDEVLARVNGRTLTEQDLALGLAITLKGEAERASEASRRKVLDSLVSTRAIAEVAKTKLSASELAEVEEDVRAHRQRLLVQKYLAAHATPAPVTDDMIAAHYAAHPEAFGATTVRSYELLATERPLSGGARAAMIATLGKAAEHADWAAWVTDLRASGHQVGVTRGQLPAAEIDPAFASAAATLGAGQTSPPLLFDGGLGVIRVIEIHDRDPRPMSEVKEAVRLHLRRQKAREAVARLRKDATRSASITYR